MSDDTISRAAAIDGLSKLQPRMIDTYEIDGDPCLKVRAVDVDEMLQNLPSAQPEIIRCKDCKHWIWHDRRCGYWNHGVKPLDWCSYAERKTDESDVNT